MDPLTLVVTQEQLKLMRDCAGQAIAELQEGQQSGQFAAEQGDQREQNVLAYGTNNYEEARHLIQGIEDQLRDRLEQWDATSDTAKPIPLSLNSYQIRVLRGAVEHQMDELNQQHLNEQKLPASEDDQQHAPQTATLDQTVHLFEDIIGQLPEYSPQEDTD